MSKLKKKIEAYYNKQEVQKEIENAKTLHQEFLNEFPLEKIEAMSVEDYALGYKKRDSFSWWLEYNTIPLGSIKGGSAAKHIIYFRKKDKKWHYPSQFPNVEKAWEQLRSDIIQLIKSFDQGTYEGIKDDNLLTNATMLKGKISYLYHPDKLMAIYNANHLRKFLKELGADEDDFKGKDSIELNIMFSELISNHEELKGYDRLLISHFLYHEFMREEIYYKIAPGHEAKYWKESLEGGYISIGWDEVGDLREFNDYEEFKSSFLTHDFQSSSQKNIEKANELWRFYQLQSGDKVIANKGKSKILGIGTVTDKGYEYRDDLEHQKHVVYVNWNETYQPALEIPKQEKWGFKTVDTVGKKQVVEWTSKPSTGNPQGSIPYTAEEERFFEMTEQALLRKGQIILYGPPGTGKTYMARKFITWKNQKDELLKKTDHNPFKIWFMVASDKSDDFRWEQIMNGETERWNLRTVARNFRNARKSEKILCYRGGSSSNGIVGIAEVSEELHDDSLGVKGVYHFKQEIPFEEFKSIPEYQSTQAGKMGNRGTMFELNDEFAIWVRETLLEYGDQEGADMLGDYMNQNNVEMSTFHPSYQYEDFMEGFKPVQSSDGTIAFELEKGIFQRFASKARENKDSFYYFIIDELNRGNVPKIFGEMITLLEMDKRGVEVRLPQSKDTFSIPDNLFIIATMNTADRSIKMMDSALKRRFAFIECMPDYDLIDKPVDLLSITPAEILKSINKKLVHLQGRDKQIGHAYFMEKGEQVTSVSEIRDVFKFEIIPLIQEYCFDDYNQLAEIIGEDFVDVMGMEINNELLNGTEDAFIQVLERQFKDSES
ncbi:AAA family ATPase [Bacillus marinisedimentorum]|uniref:AAA family ATPase n=1 Tax=Bacillus marinisedimentorum TaxID=1821260 RepID=UPI0007E18B49|nr:AAA family ATPase [Bacillus marinisedimentorum]